MEKATAIGIISRSAQLYKEHLEDKVVLFVYGSPQEMKKYMNSSMEGEPPLRYYEATFLRRNFDHLTGVKKAKHIKSSIHFYEKVLYKKLNESDFEFNDDGTTVQKLEILECLMQIKTTAAMFGDYINAGPKLYTEKVSGTTNGCMGFVYSKEDRVNVPNTLLNKDIREIIPKPNNKIYAIFYRNIKKNKYSNISKLDRDIDFTTFKFTSEIEKRVDRESIIFDFKKSK